MACRIEVQEKIDGILQSDMRMGERRGRIELVCTPPTSQHDIILHTLIFPLPSLSLPSQ